MTDLKPLTSLMASLMIEVMRRHMAIEILSKALQRKPTVLEILYYENELWRWELSRWYQNRLNIYQVIHDLIWG